jgi:hypothetical protein
MREAGPPWGQSNVVHGIEHWSPPQLTIPVAIDYLEDRREPAMLRNAYRALAERPKAIAFWYLGRLSNVVGPSATCEGAVRRIAAMWRWGRSCRASRSKELYTQDVWFLYEMLSLGENGRLVDLIIDSPPLPEPKPALRDSRGRQQRRKP